MCWDFSDCLFLSLSFLFTLVVSMAPKRKSVSSRNTLHFGASSSSNLTPSSIQFRDKDARKDFSENAESFWRTSLTLTYSMSFTVGVGSHCVTSRSHVLPC